MAYRVDYELKQDKRGVKYALKVNLKTGKKSRVPYKIAEKRKRGLVHSRRAEIKKQKIVIKLREQGAGATYKDYKRVLPTLEREIRSKRLRDEKPPLKESIVRSRAKQQAIEYRTGIATRFRFAWTYKPKLATYIDEETGKIVNECDSPAFIAGKDFINGDEFGRLRDSNGYHKFIGVCEKVLDEIIALDPCTLDGGACILLYDKFTKDVIKQQEFGRGCGFKFDFKNYHEDQNILEKVISTDRRI